MCVYRRNGYSYDGYFCNDRNIQFRLWEYSKDHFGNPDIPLVIIRISFRCTHDVIHAEMKAFIYWLKQTARRTASSTSQTKTAGPFPPAKYPAAASPASASTNP